MISIRHSLARIWRKLNPAPPVPPVPVMPWQHAPQVVDLLKIVRPYSLYSEHSLAMILALALLARDVEGDFVECGVANGGTAAMLAATLKTQPGKELWLYDTFEGMPEPTREDGPDAQSYVGAAKGSEATVREVLSKVGFNIHQSRLIRGLFQETFKQTLPDKIALLHIDADWYESVFIALETLVPRVVDGGVIILDDFGHWEGTRLAFYEYCAQHGLAPLVERYGHTQMFWRKGQENTRDSVNWYYPHGSLSAHFSDLYEML